MENTVRKIIITGCNKGIGYGIVSGLVKKPYHIIMACRNAELAEKARQEVAAGDADALQRLEVLTLDVADPKSIEQFATDLKARHPSGVDILLNNAGFAYKGDAWGEKVARDTLTTNFFGTAELTERLIPQIKDNGKIIIVGSQAGLLTKLKSADLLARFTNPQATLDDLKALGNEFIDEVAKDTYEQKGWPRTTYGVSKMLINTYARVLGGRADVVSRGIQAYALCPGWVKTDMAGSNAPLTIEQGAQTPIYLVELPYEINHELQGKFFYEKKVRALTQ